MAGRSVLLLRDVTAEVRREEGLRLAQLSRLLLGKAPAMRSVLQSLCTEARTLTGADYSALLLLRKGSLTETSHFVYDASRHLFPERMPPVRAFDDVDEALMVDLAAHASAAVAWAQVAERERALVRQDVVDTARHDIRTPVGAGKGFAPAAAAPPRSHVAGAGRDRAAGPGPLLRPHRGVQ